MAKGIQKRYWLVSHRERWGLTRWGWLLILLCLAGAGWVLTTHVYPFLSPTHRVPAQVLVVEGAVPDYMLDSAMQEFKRGHYALLVTTGTPLEWGHLLIEFGNTASVAAASLKRMGFDTTKLVTVATQEIRNDRTFNSAMEFARYLRSAHPEYTSVNLMSYGAHSRRSWLMFKEALGDKYDVGIISMQSLYYGANDWWKSSKGFREVINELLGYVFVKLFFHPYALGTGQPTVKQVNDTLVTH